MIIKAINCITLDFEKSISSKFLIVEAATLPMSLSTVTKMKTVHFVLGYTTFTIISTFNLFLTA